MCFDSRVVCESECDTSKDNGSFATLSLSSTVAAPRPQLSGSNYLTRALRVPTRKSEK